MQRLVINPEAEAKFEILSDPCAPMVSLRRPVKIKASGVSHVLAVGTQFCVLFGKIAGEWWMRVSGVVTLPGGDGSSGTETQIVFLTRQVTAFFEPPPTDELQSALNDGRCATVLGLSDGVEPDGFDEQGSPSWLIALGMI